MTDLSQEDMDRIANWMDRLDQLTFSEKKRLLPVLCYWQHAEYFQRLVNHIHTVYPYLCDTILSSTFKQLHTCGKDAYRMDAIRWLTNACPDMNFSINISCVDIILSHCNMETLETMVTNNPDINLENYPYLVSSACFNNDIRVVKYMHKLISNYQFDRSDFIHSCETGNINIPLYILSNNPNIDINDAGGEAFSRALTSKNREIMKWLLDTIPSIKTEDKKLHLCHNIVKYKWPKSIIYPKINSIAPHLKWLRTQGYVIDNSEVEHIIPLLDIELIDWLYSEQNIDHKILAGTFDYLPDMIEQGTDFIIHAFKLANTDDYYLTNYECLCELVHRNKETVGHLVNNIRFPLEQISRALFVCGDINLALELIKPRCFSQYILEGIFPYVLLNAKYCTVDSIKYIYDNNPAYLHGTYIPIIFKNVCYEGNIEVATYLLSLFPELKLYFREIILNNFIKFRIIVWVATMHDFTADEYYLLFVNACLYNSDQAMKWIMMKCPYIDLCKNNHILFRSFFDGEHLLIPFMYTGKNTNNVRYVTEQNDDLYKPGTIAFFVEMLDEYRFGRHFYYQFFDDVGYIFGSGPIDGWEYIIVNGYGVASSLEPNVIFIDKTIKRLINKKSAKSIL
jgi:hypothetical protein